MAVARVVVMAVVVTVVVVTTMMLLLSLLLLLLLVVVVVVVVVVPLRWVRGTRLQPRTGSGANGWVRRSSPPPSGA